MKLNRVAEHLYRSEPHGTYYAVVKCHGRKRRASLKTTDRQLAAARLPEKLERLRGYQPGAPITFEQLVAEWKARRLQNMDLKPRSRADREQHLRLFARTCPGWLPMRLRKLTPAHMETWETRRVKEIGPQRFNNELGTLRMMFLFSIEEGWLLTDPTAKVKRRKIQQRKARIPAREEFRAIIADLVKRKNLQAAWFVESIAYNGLRRNENASLEWNDVDDQRGTVRITGGEAGTKNREERDIPLFPAFRELVKRIPRILGQKRIFQIQECYEGLRGACDRLKLPRFHHHHFVHFFCSNAIEEGIDFKTIAEWRGHKDGGILVAQTYGHLRPEHSARMAARMTFSARRGQVGVTTTPHFRPRPVRKTA